MITYDKELQMHVLTKTPAFEGWYFRFVEETISVAVIIGVASTNEKQDAFIQVFHTLGNIVEKIQYDRQEFEYIENPFMVRIQKSFLSKHHIHIEDERLSILIDIEFPNVKHLRKTKYAPTIMGPFSYLDTMECSHAVINLESDAFGFIKYEGIDYRVEGLVYQEKDWGTSFPSKYIWIQSNHCVEKKAILFLSCATIPLKLFSFTGVIMTLDIEGKQYCFASYYGAVVRKACQEDGGYRLCIRQGIYAIDFFIEMDATFTLDAPYNGMMSRSVKECLLGKVKVTLHKGKQCIGEVTFNRCGIENDHFFID